MGIAALILGILAVVVGLVPMCGLVFGLPLAIVGLILGIVDVKARTKKEQPKGVGVAGLILNVLAIVVILVWTLVIGAAAKHASENMEGVMEDVQAGLEQAAEDAAAAAEAAAAEAAE